jgi:transposase InsO family protein
LKAALVDAPVLTWPDFKRTFWLDVDWSTKGVGAILSQKEGKFEKVIAYASKNLTEAQRKFHPMEGECYALIWGVMHFRQYLHMKHFILRTDHKPLEWLATVSDAHGRQGRWVGMLQDFSFKIVHRPRFKHMNVDALSRNPIGSATDDDGFGEELQDVAGPEANVPEGETRTGNKYILVAIDHYSKWCEAKAVADHGAKTAARFLEDDVICRYGVPEFVLTDNGGEWAAEFDAMCKDYGIHHQHTTPQWPQCNGMAERLIKMIKQGITILSATPENANCWDEQLAKVLFGYRCGIQASTKFYDSDWADTTPEG